MGGMGLTLSLIHIYYAERLIDEPEPLDWPESIKLLQRNWIGKSEGAEVDFTLNGKTITVYTTRPDTLFAATYMVLSLSLIHI